MLEFIKCAYLSIVANSTLFLSSLIFLINLSPKKFYPSYRKRIKAISKLRSAQNILGRITKDLDIRPQTRDMSMILDDESFEILKKLVQDYLPLSKNIKWENAVGIGYSTIKLPVGRLSLDAFHPLYIVEMPDASNPNQLLLNPVGQLQDLNNWLASLHQNSMTKLALILLGLGFFLQLIDSLL